jgi:hypothetical protein
MRVLLVACILALVLSGCASSYSNLNFDADGIPHYKFYVGGGMNFEYATFVPGHIYVVDTVSNRVVAIRPGDGDGSNFGVSDLDVDLSNERDVEGLQELGFDTSNMKYALYFIPAKQSVEVKE